jgi:4-hydroxyphenylpyruvate dioxygenase
MVDFCPIRRFDHLEFYVGNAKQAAQFYSRCLGFTNTAYRGLETGIRDTASYVMEQGEIGFVLTSALSPEHEISRSVLKHGDAIAIVALEVPDADKALWETTSRGAEEAIPLTEESDKDGVLRYSGIHVYGDVIIKFIERSQYTGRFAPGFQPCNSNDNSDNQDAGAGLTHIDHVVANVESGAMDRWVQFFKEVMGFDLLVHFTDENISTEYSALMSKVMQDCSGRIKLPINEPAFGQRKSQIQEYLEYHGGPGIQHVALATRNIVETVTQLKASGVKFLPTPKTYYDDLENRVGKINEPIDQLAELGILVDRDAEGYLLQIFTELVQDRPTLFFEIIERHGAQGFGEGNFKALFEAIEREQALRGNL